MVKAPNLKDVMVFASAAEFRAWLERHHANESEAWIGYYKKGVAKRSITYPESVDEALCFGWIDGIGYRISDEVHANRFTPRTKRSNWSATNVRRVGELTTEGRMHPAGLAAFEARTPERTGVYSYENRPADLPSAYLEQLKSNADAWRFWQARSPSYRRAATWWVVSAKLEATRERRLETLVEDSAAGRVIKPLRAASAGMTAPDLARLQAEAEAAGRRCVVGALVRDERGRVFVHRRGPNRVWLPNGWDVLGGHVEAGESLLEALAREINEESGWQLAGTPRLLFTADWESNETGTPNRRREFDFLVEVRGDLAHPRLERPQHTEYRWIGPDDVGLLDENEGRDFGIVRQIVELALAQDATPTEGR